MLINDTKNYQVHNIPTSKTTIFGCVANVIGKSETGNQHIVFTINIRINKIIFISNVIYYNVL